MKKLIIILILVFFAINDCMAGSINPKIYQTMSSVSYRNNYNRQINNNPIPYWQAQSNYATRNKSYNNYANYNSSMYRYYSSVNSNRRYK